MAQKEICWRYQVLADLTRCGICLDTLECPRTLPCLHTFCEGCLEQLVTGALPLSCPTCRIPVARPRGGVTGFPYDFRIHQIKEVFADYNARKILDQCCVTSVDALPESPIQVGSVNELRPAASVSGHPGTPTGCHALLYKNHLGEGHVFEAPRDACVVRGALVIADTGNSCLQVYRKGQKVGSIGGVIPWAVCGTPKGRIAVADAEAQCVKILSLEGATIAKFGHFLCPCSIAITHSSKIIVLDFFTTSVQVWDKNLNLVRKFDYRAPSETLHSTGPANVAVNKEHRIAIVDVSNNSMKIYNKYGCLRGCVPASKVLTPRGVSCDSEGYFWVVDSATGMLVQVNSSGEVLQALPLANYNHSNAGEHLGLCISDQGLVAVVQSLSNQVTLHHMQECNPIS